METLLNWIHILSFAMWLGANLFCLVIFLPASKSLPSEAKWQARHLASRRLSLVAAISAPLVVISGSAWLLLPEPNAGSASWQGESFFMAAKATLTLAMIFNHVLQAFRYAPQPLRDGTTSEFDQLQTAWTHWVRLLAINVILGFAVFVFGLFLV